MHFSWMILDFCTYEAAVFCSKCHNLRFMWWILESFKRVHLFEHNAQKHPISYLNHNWNCGVKNNFWASNQPKCPVNWEWTVSNLLYFFTNYYALHPFVLFSIFCSFELSVMNPLDKIEKISPNCIYFSRLL